MKKISFVFPILFLIQLIYAQEITSSTDSIDHAIQETVKVDFSNTIKIDQAIVKLKKTYALSKKLRYEKGILESGDYIMIFYYRQAKYEAVIEFASDIEESVNLERSSHFYSVSKFYRNLALSYMKLGFDEKGSAEYQNSIKYAKKIKDKEEEHFTLGIIYNDKALYFNQTKKYPDSVGYYLFKTLREIESLQDKAKIDKFGGKMLIYSSIGAYYLNVSQPRDTALAKKYFIKSEEIYNHSKPSILAINEVEYLLTLSNFYFNEKDYEKAIVLTKKALEIDKKKTSNPYKRKNMYGILTKSYLEIGNKEQSKVYLNLFTHISDSLDLAEKNNIIAPLNQIIKKNNKVNAEQTQKILILITITLFFTSIFVYIVVKRNQKKTRERYEKLIRKIKENKVYISKEPEPDSSGITDTQMSNNKILLKIPDETINALILKLNKFESSNGFLKKDLTLTSLAHSLNTNPKYLSEIIKYTKSKSFNNYINNLRINYITGKLYEEAIYRQYKIKYLAEECGYASPQVFVIAFKKENGVTPSYYIEQLKKDQKTTQSV